MTLPLATFDYHYGEIGINLSAVADKHVLFNTDANSGLWDILAHLSVDDQQTFKCKLCSETLATVCNLVYFDEFGQKRAFFWRNYPTDNADTQLALDILAEFVERCPIVDIPTTFIKVDKYFPQRVGTAVQGGFGHYWCDIKQNQTLPLSHFKANRKLLSSWLLNDSLAAIVTAIEWVCSINQVVSHTDLNLKALHNTLKHTLALTNAGLRPDAALIRTYAALTDITNQPTFIRGLNHLAQIRDSKLMELIIGIIGARDGDARIQCYLDWIQHTNPVLYDLIAMWQNAIPSKE